MRFVLFASGWKNLADVDCLEAKEKVDEAEEDNTLSCKSGCCIDHMWIGFTRVLMQHRIILRLTYYTYSTFKTVLCIGASIR